MSVFESGRTLGIVLELEIVLEWDRHHVSPLTGDKMKAQTGPGLWMRSWVAEPHLGPVRNPEGF